MDIKIDKDRQDRLLTIRDLIRETLLGNAAIIFIAYILSLSLPPQNIPDYIVITLCLLTILGLSYWMFQMAFIYIIQLTKALTALFLFMVWIFLIQFAIYYKFDDIFGEKLAYLLFK